MIESFGNKTAKTLWETSQCKGIDNKVALRAKALLSFMHATSTLKDLQVCAIPPNPKLHKLKGDRKNEWSMWIATNSPLRIVFKFADGKFFDVKVEDYH